MDPLRFRQRKLFRPAALEYFVGAFGDSGTPELLAARRTRLAWCAVSALAAMVIAWGFAGSLPLRVAVTGKIVALDSAKPYFLGSGTQVQSIRSGQEARVALDATQPNGLGMYATPVPLTPTLSRFAGEGANESLREIHFTLLKGQVEKVSSANEVAIALAPDAANACRGNPGQDKATAWITVGRQTPVQFLLGRTTW